MSHTSAQSTVEHKVKKAVEEAVQKYNDKKNAEMKVGWMVHHKYSEGEKSSGSRWNALPNMSLVSEAKGNKLRYIFKITGEAAFLAEFGKGQFTPLKISQKKDKKHVYTVKAHQRSRRSDGTISDGNIKISSYKRTMTTKGHGAFKPKYYNSKGEEVVSRVGVDGAVLESNMFKAYVSSSSYNKARFGFDTQRGHIYKFLSGHSNINLDNALLSVKEKPTGLFTDYFKNSNVWSYNGGYYIWRAMGIDIRHFLEKGTAKLTLPSQGKVAPPKTRVKGIKAIDNPNKELKQCINDAVLGVLRAKIKF